MSLFNDDSAPRLLQQLVYALYQLRMPTYLHRFQTLTPRHLRTNPR